MAGQRRSGTPRSARTTPDRACDPLGVLIEDERSRAQHPILEALLEAARRADGPPALRQAAESLLRASAPWSLEVDGALSQVLDACGDQRSRRLFLEWSLNRRHRPTVAMLARQIGLSRRRTRELLDRSEGGVRETFARAPAPVPWTVATLRQRLGVITTTEAAYATMADLGVKSARGVDLVLWLSGPYREIPGYPGWLGQAGDDVVARTEACLSAAGGVHRLVDVVQEIAPALSVGQMGEWLSAWGAVVVSDVVVSVSGPLADVVERVLDAHGTPLTLDAVSLCVAAGGRNLAMDTLLAVTRGRRFRRESDGRLALADWNGPSSAPPRTSGAGEGGRQPDPVVDRSAAASHATRAKPPPPAHVVGDDGRLVLWVRIDTEALRGGEASVPLSLVEGLGLAPGCRRTFSSRYGPVTLANEGTTANRRSIRAVALAAGAHINDTLLLNFSARGDIDVGVRRHPGDSDTATLTSIDTTIFPRSANPGAT